MPPEYGTGPEEWMQWVSLFQYAGIVAGALIPLALLFKSVRDWLAKKWRAIINSRVSQRQFAEKLEAVRSEITTKMESVDHKVEHLVTCFATIDKVLERCGLMESMLRITADRDDLSATIYCDDRGSVTFASRAMTTWLKTSRSDLLGWRWLNFVETSERKAIRDEVLLVQSEHRELRMKINMGPHGETKTPYLLTMSPMPDNPPAKAWAGYIMPLHTAGPLIGA